MLSLYEYRLIFFLDARESSAVSEERLRGAERPALGRTSQAVQLVYPAPTGLYSSLCPGPAGIRQPEIHTAVRHPRRKSHDSIPQVPLGSAKRSKLCCSSLWCICVNGVFVCLTVEIQVRYSYLLCKIFIIFLFDSDGDFF